jgi:hypothetical protein
MQAFVKTELRRLLGSDPDQQLVDYIVRCQHDEDVVEYLHVCKMNDFYSRSRPF